MGRRGTDVAREAADLVLLDDSFASIVGGVRLGRRIFANLRRALIYITAVHVPIAGLALAPVLLGLPPMLLPMHVVLLELVIDPICSLVFESVPSEADAMSQPPRRPKEALFGASQIAIALLQGVSLLGAILALYWFGLVNALGPEPAVRGAAFLALVVGNLVLALSDSVSSDPVFGAERRTYWAITGAVLVVLSFLLTVAPLARLFDMSLPSPGLLTLALGVGVVGGGWTGLATRGRRSRED